MEFKKSSRHDIRRPERTPTSRRSVHANSTHPSSPLSSGTPSRQHPTRSHPVSANTNKHTLQIKDSDTAPATSLRTRALAKKPVLIGAITLVLCTVIFILIQQHIHTRDVEKDISLNAAVEELEYQTVLPQNKSITDLGGWKRISPAKSEPVFAYADKIGNVPISVSQQPLPLAFIGSTEDQVAELAKSYNATDEIQVDRVKVYIGSSAKGPQSAIFTRNSLLILIKSEDKIENDEWTSYIKSLN